MTSSFDLLLELNLLGNLGNCQKNFLFTIYKLYRRAHFLLKKKISSRLKFFLRNGANKSLAHSSSSEWPSLRSSIVSSPDKWSSRNARSCSRRFFVIRFLMQPEQALKSTTIYLLLKTYSIMRNWRNIK